jgi:hypothetical protein
MSWDLFVNNIPREFASVSEIPEGFVQRSLGSRRQIVDKICAVVPNADFSDPSWGLIDGDGYSIEVNIGKDDPVTGFAFHIRGGDNAVYVVADILDYLGLRAFDPQSDSGFFSLKDGPASLQKWRAYRNKFI